MSKNITKILALTVLLTSSFTSTALAWGPERITYTNEQPADYATFNSITNNAGVGDERNFVRVKEIGSGENFRDEVEVTPGKEYEVYIYYHNNAASDTNETGYGIATDTRVFSSYPTTLNVGERGMVSSIITWSYINPTDDSVNIGKVWDEAYLTTKTNGVVLKFKASSAVIHNGGPTNGSILPTTLFREKGTPIGYEKLEGILKGCAEYSGHITYTLVAEKNEDCATNPDLPECKNCDTNPDLPECQKKDCTTNPEMEGCQELPNTGPVEIIMAIIIIAGIGGGGYYLYRTKRTLKTAENVAKGEEPKDAKEAEIVDSSQKPDNMVKQSE